MSGNKYIILNQSGLFFCFVHDATTWTYNNVPQNFLFDRGFTGQEHLDVFGLINLNGRSYDPWLGRFLSVDPIVDDLSNTQRFNSYTYANNNPMRFVDPTGYDGFDDVYLGPGMQAWVKPEQDGNNAFFGSGGGGGGGGNGFHYSYTDHAYEDANGNIVGWDYVFYDFVQANAAFTINFTDLTAFGSDANPYQYFSLWVNGKRWNSSDGLGALQNMIDDALQGGGAGSGNYLDLANDIASGFGVGLRNMNGSFRVTNGSYFSPKYYESGWKGGSRAEITTYSASEWGNDIGKGSIIISFAIGSYDIYRGIQQDGGTFGLNAQLATGEIIGGIGGAELGSEVGAGFGAIPGGIVGGVIGGWLGSKFGETVILKLHE